MRLNMKSNSKLLLERLLVAAFFLYIEWYKQIWGDNLRILYGSVFVLSCLILFRMIRERYFQIGAMPSLLKMFILYFVFSISGVFVARDIDVLFSSLITFVCFIVVCFDCWYISFQLGNVDWLYKILGLIALICSVQVIFCGKPYNNGVIVTTMSNINNPNTLGLTLITGILSFVINVDFKSQFSFFVSLVTSVMMLYGIILSGSRKCLLVSAPILIFWLFSYVRTTIKERRYRRLLITLLLIAIAIYTGAIYLAQSFQSTAAFERLMLLFQEGGMSTRIGLYHDAVDYFKTSPIIGIGFGQYRLWSPHRYYSHSSYAEVLSCGGLIGVCIFFLPLFKCLCSCIHQAFQKDQPEKKYRLRMLMLMLFSELFLGLGQIFIYDVLHMLMLVLISMECRPVFKVDIRSRNQFEANNLYQAFSVLKENDS